MGAEPQVPQPVRQLPGEPDGAAHHHVALRGHGEPRVRDQFRGEHRRAFFPSFIYPHRARAAKGSTSADITGVSSAQDIDFAALYKAYDDELMAWKAVIDDRHAGEKHSKGPSSPPGRSIAC